MSPDRARRIIDRQRKAAHERTRTFRINQLIEVHNYHPSTAATIIDERDRNKNRRP